MENNNIHTKINEFITYTQDEFNFTITPYQKKALVATMKMLASLDESIEDKERDRHYVGHHCYDILKIITPEFTFRELNRYSYDCNLEDFKEDYHIYDDVKSELQEDPKFIEDVIQDALKNPDSRAQIRLVFLDDPEVIDHVAEKIQDDSYNYGYEAGHEEAMSQIAYENSNVLNAFLYDLNKDEDVCVLSKLHDIFNTQTKLAFHECVLLCNTIRLVLINTLVETAERLCIDNEHDISKQDIPDLKKHNIAGDYPHGWRDRLDSYKGDWPIQDSVPEYYKKHHRPLVDDEYKSWTRVETSVDDNNVEDDSQEDVTQENKPIRRITLVEGITTLVPADEEVRLIRK